MWKIITVHQQWDLKLCKMCKTITFIIHTFHHSITNHNHKNNNNNNNNIILILQLLGSTLCCGATLPSIHQRDPTHRIFKFGTPEVFPHAQKQPRQWVEVNVVFHSWLEWNMNTKNDIDLELQLRFKLTNTSWAPDYLQIQNGTQMSPRRNWETHPQIYSCTALGPKSVFLCILP